MSENIGLIAGKGQFPLLFAQAARSHGVEVIAAAHRGETDPALAPLVKELHWVYVGQLGKIIRIFKAAGVKRAVMAGGITRGRLFKEFRPDLRALSVVRRAGAGKDDRLLRAVAAELENEGISVAPSTLFLDDLLAPAGQIGRRAPSREELQDIELGFRVAKEMGALDIGQCVVVRRQVVVALEAIEGTDETIRRGGTPGRRRRRGGESEQTPPGPALRCPRGGARHHCRHDGSGGRGAGGGSRQDPPLQPPGDAPGRQPGQDRGLGDSGGRLRAQAPANKRFHSAFDLIPLPNCRNLGYHRAAISPFQTRSTT